MTIKLTIRHKGKNIPSALIFSEIPIHPKDTEYYFAALKDDTNVEIERFVNTTIDGLLKDIKVYLDSNLMKVEIIIKPYSNPSFYSDEFEENEHILLVD